MSPHDDPAARAAKRRLQLQYFMRYKGAFALGAAALIATNLMALAIPARLGGAIEQLRAQLSLRGAQALAEQLLVSQQLREAGLWIMALAVGAMTARILSRIWIFNAGRGIEFDLRDALYERLTQLDASYYGATPTGEVTSLVTNDVGYIRLLYALTFLHAINALLAYGIALQKMVGLDWALTLWCLSPYPLLILGLRQVTRRLFEQTRKVQEQLGALSSRVQENLAGMTVVKTFNLQAHERQSFDALAYAYYQENMTLAVYRGLLNALMVVAAGLGTVVVLMVGARAVSRGQMTLGQFVEFNGYVVSLAFPTVALGWVFSVWHRGQAAFARVMALLERPSALPEASAPRELPSREASAPNDGPGDAPGDTPGDAPRASPAPSQAPSQALGRIKLDRVSFTYPHHAQGRADQPGSREHDASARGLSAPDVRAPALHELELVIEAGSRVAIVGKTGSGKTTLARLLARQHDPDQGAVRLDGVDLRELELRALRAELGVVPQDPFLFSMTIEQNLRFGLDALERDATLKRALPTRSLLDPTRSGLETSQRVAQAVQIAGLTRDLEALPQGLDTMVGERGVTLSGGQKQRVTLARALLMDPRVLILDDALSSVDAQTEATILEHLEQIMRGRTTVLITHRYNALAHMDQIVVMDRGRIVERGDHQTLLAANGLYARMVAQQKRREELES